MSQSIPPTCANLAIALLIHYSFDLSGYSAGELINRWQKQYPPDWLHLAVIEALYQGRYKGISVQQILAFWLRRGQAISHFNMEFERLICSQFPSSLTATTTKALNFHPETAQTQTVKYYLEPAVVASPPAENGNGNHQSSSIQLIDVQQQESVSAEETTPLTASSIQPQVNPPQIDNQKLDNLPIVLNHPPIGQFTPVKSDRIESFTSKLKAMSVGQ